MPHEGHLLNPDEARNLGTGLEFLTDWDFKVKNGSLQLITGIAVLGRDLAFTLQRTMDVTRGQRFGPDFREDVRLEVRRTVLDDDRVESVTVQSIEPTDDTRREVEVTIKAVAVTGEEGEFVIRT